MDTTIPLSVSVAALLGEWANWLKNLRKMSPHTLAAYQSDVQHFLAFQNNHHGKMLAVDEVDTLTVRDFRAWLAFRSTQDYEHRSTARALSVVRSFYRFLTRQGRPANAAIAVIRSPRIKVGLPRPLSVEETAYLIDDIGHLSSEPWIGSRNRALFTLLYACGLRLGEALTLKRSQVSGESDVLLVEGKGKRQRHVPLLPEARQALLDYIALCPYSLSADTPLFTGAKGGKLNPGMAQKTMRHYKRFTGLSETATPHALRHSCATHLMSNSGDLRGIQELLGHASLTTTQVYTDVDTVRLLKVYQNAHPRARKTEKPDI
jgi:integrase/recombinase XerC